MTSTLAPGYHPLVDPARASSLPDALPARSPVVVPMRPRRQPRTIRRLDLLRAHGPTWASFAVSDRILMRFERQDPLGVRALDDSGPWEGATTMDVPYYAFFTPMQRVRALARTLWAQQMGVDALEKRGILPLPLVKGLEPGPIGLQVRALAETGLRAAAFYAREAILEGEEAPLRAFLRACRRHRVAPVLLGRVRPGPPAWGRFAAVGAHHVVAARHGRRLHRTLAASLVTTPGFWSGRLARWVHADQVSALADHNLLTVQAAHQQRVTATLRRWGA